MITQYTTSYGTIPSDFVNLVANSVALGDKYILMRTGEYEYTALVKTPYEDKAELIVCRRTSNNSTYTVTRSKADYAYQCYNEYYVYSNDGVGKSLDIPAYQATTSYGIGAIVIFLCLWILFKEVLFRPWLKSSRR